MNTTDRMFSIVWGFISAAFVASVFLIGSCSNKQDVINAPISMVKAKSDHLIKMKCIETRGDWVHEDGSDRCKFTK